MRDLEKILKALANKRRLAIVIFLKSGGATIVGDIAEEIKLSFKSTSKHLAILYTAGVLDREQIGLEVFYKIAVNPHKLVDYVSNSRE